MVERVIKSNVPIAKNTVETSRLTPDEQLRLLEEWHWLMYYVRSSPQEH